MFDCIIVGAGPAGLTAALYLARFLRRVLVVENRKSRATKIPLSHNYPGFEAIGGDAILARLRGQLKQYNVQFQRGTVLALTKRDGEFLVQTEGQSYLTRRLFLATGIVDEAPEIAGLPDLIQTGLVRYCPICDAFEAKGKNIAILTNSPEGWRKALFLRTYSKQVSLLTSPGFPGMASAVRRDLGAANITVEDSTVSSLTRVDGGIGVSFSNGATRSYDVLYPVLGCRPQSEMALELGAEGDEVGCLIVNAHQETTIQGIFAGGDVVSDLHQISIALAHGAIAATAIHNSLPSNYQ